MKKIFYIICFGVLGALVQFLAHAGIEIWYIGLLTSDFQKYSLGLSFGQLVIIHHIATVILLVVGILLGIWQGKYWWKRLCEDKRK